MVFNLTMTGKGRTRIVLLTLLFTYLLLVFTPHNIPKVYAMATVGTTTTSDATSYNMQRKVWYASGLYWVFYSDGTNMVYSTSSTGDFGTWSSPSTIRASVLGKYFSTWFNDTHFFYVYSGLLDGLYFRCGTLESDGAITWVQDEQTILVSLLEGVPTIVTDSSGYPYVSYETSAGYPYVAKSSKNDGTWTNATGFPYQLNTTSSGAWRIILVPLTQQKVYAVYGRGGGNPLNGRLWNGTDWESEDTVSTSNFNHAAFMSGVNEGDNIHLCFLNTPHPYDLMYVHYDGSTWASEEVVEADITSFACLAINPSNSYIYNFEGDGDWLYIRINNNGTWGSRVRYVYDPDQVMYSISCAYSVTDGKLPCIWTLETPNVVNGYSVKFDFLPLYHYSFYGSYDEDTGLLKDASERAVNVTAYFTDGTPPITFEVNGSQGAPFKNPPQYFLFDLAKDREYWISPNENGTLMYIFDCSLTTYYITFIDLSGVLGTYSWISASRYINGTLMVVEKRKADVAKTVVMNLKQGQTYVIHVEAQAGTSYTFGDVAMTSDTTPELTIKGIDFPQEIILAYRYVRMYAYRSENGTHVTAMYEDTRNNTDHTDVFIKYENGTIANEGGSGYTSTSYTFQYIWTGADNETNYYIEIKCYHNEFGLLEYRLYLPRIWSEAPFSLDVLWPSSTITTSAIIPALIILAVAGAFSTLNAQVGAFAAVVTALILTYIGWISIPVGFLIVAVASAILMGIIYARRRVRVY